MRPTLDYQEELIEVAEDCEVLHAIAPTYKGHTKPVHRIAYEVLSEHPYTFNEQEFHHEVHVVRRHRVDLKLDTYTIKRSPLVKRFGWGIHRNSSRKLGLVARESELYQALQNDPHVKKTPSCRTSKE